MKTIGTIVALMLVSGTATAANPTFGDCESAENYGYATAWQLTSAVMNKAACSEIAVRKGEVALARQAKRQKIPAHNPQEHKICFYAGFYAGYVDALVVEAGQCNAPVELASVARAASAVFTAMHESLIGINDAIVDQVFDGVFTAPNLGEDAIAEQCEEPIYDDVLDLEAGLDELVDSVCRND